LIFQGKSVFFKELNYSYVKRLSGIYRFTDTEMAVNSNTPVYKKLKIPLAKRNKMWYYKFQVITHGKLF